MDISAEAVAFMKELAQAQSYQGHAGELTLGIMFDKHTADMRAKIESLEDQLMEALEEVHCFR